jgi:type IV pilus assembly protein PilQ
MSTLKRAKTILVLAAVLTMISSSLPVAAAPSSGPPPAATIVSLRHVSDGNQTRIIVEGTAELPYTIYRPDERTILVDMPGVDASKLTDSYAVDSLGVERVQVERLRTASGQSLVRLRVRLKGTAEDRSVVEGNSLVLTLTSSVAAAPTRPAASGAAVPALVVEHEEPVAKPVSPVAPPRAAAAANPATVISSLRTEVDGDQTRVVISTDGRAPFKHFVLPDPDRIVVDVTGVKSNVEKSAVDVNKGGISRIRIGQFRTAEPRIVRIVFDVASLGAYDVKQVGKDLVLTMKSSASTPTATSRTATAPSGVARTAVSTPASNTPSTATKAAIEPVAAPARPAPKPPVVSGDDPTIVKPVVKPAESSPMASMRTVADERPKPKAPPKATAGAPPAPATPAGGSDDVLGEGYVGKPASFHLRSADIRDILRWIHGEFGVNFIVDGSIKGPVPVTIDINAVPWNVILEAVLRANGLGYVKEGPIIRIATNASLAQERKTKLEAERAKFNALPLVTKIYRLKYASVVEIKKVSDTGPGRSSAGSAQDPKSVKTGIVAVIAGRLSTRGNIDVDIRTNSLVISDLADRLAVMEQIIRALDRPEPQVEIEARIVVARRSFLRDLGVRLSAAVMNRDTGGLIGITTLPSEGGRAGIQFPGTTQVSTTNVSTTTVLPTPNIPGGLAGGPAPTGQGDTVINLTTGILGTFQISAAITAEERKGLVRTISSPRVTTQNNATAEIVNGVQIPIQTVDNLTVSVEYVEAALSLKITPQIITEDGAVLLGVIASNDSVGAILTTAGPSINTQSANTVVLVPDGGTTVIGGINVDLEGQEVTRTPGLGRIPIFGHLFRRKVSQKQTDEILFFVTPRIFRPELVGLTEQSIVRSSDVTITPVLAAGSEGGVVVLPEAPGEEGEE